MAAFGLHGGHTIQRNCRFLVNNVKLFLGKRSFCRSAALQQQTEPEHQETSETIFIPRKKTWSKEAVLEALASTVGRDFTALPHKFQDDLYLSPRTFTESVIFSLSLNSGSAAAKYFINSNPMFFTKDFSEPHIPCLMPENVSLRLEEVSEEALKERIHLRKVQAAVDLYDQLLQAGTAVSMETTHDLLDLICLYCDRDPVQEGQPKLEYLSMERGKESQKSRWDTLLSKKPLNSSWTKNKNSERIFNLLPERDTRSYSALIRGMVMHNAPAKAFSFYTDMLNHRLKPDIHIFNALISAAPHVNPTSQEKSEAIIKLLKEMNQQNIQPNLQTFNNVLRSLKHCPPYNRLLSLKTMAEMKALGIAPSLASYSHILSIFTKEVSGEPSITDFLEEIMSELAGKSFTCQDPDDVYFFMNAMKLCCAQKDLELAYKVQSLVEFGENWRLLGHHYMQNVYYGFFFRLQCMMEHIDVVLTWFRQHYPSLYYPTHAEIVYLLRALETEGRLDLLPSIWKDICSLKYELKDTIIEELLSLMTREKHSLEVQKSFGECALDVKRMIDQNVHGVDFQWSNSALSNFILLLLRANMTQQAWDMLQLFKSKNRVPREDLIEEFLTVCRSSGSPDRAMELVQLSSTFGLSATPRLAKFTLAEFKLTDEQRSELAELESAESP